MDCPSNNINMYILLGFSFFFFPVNNEFRIEEIKGTYVQLRKIQFVVSRTYNTCIYMRIFADIQK